LCCGAAINCVAELRCRQQQKKSKNCVLKMGSKSVPSIALFLSLNVLLFSMVSCNTPAPAKCPDMKICKSAFAPPFKPDPNCCPLLGGLTDNDAAVCICSFVNLTFGSTIYQDILVNALLRACARKETTNHCKFEWDSFIICCWVTMFLALFFSEFKVNESVFCVLYAVSWNLCTHSMLINTQIQQILLRSNCYIN